MLVIVYNMVTSFIGVECHFQQYVSYSVEHGDQFYWCLTTLSTIAMFYVVTDTLLKVLLNTNKTGHHVLRYTWHIVESVVRHCQQYFSYDV
jgi:hypothetical protein